MNSTAVLFLEMISKATWALILWAMLLLPAKADDLSFPDTLPLLKENGPSLPLTIQECISRALAKNLDISIERISPQIASAQTLSARGIYDPVLSLHGQNGELTQQLALNSSAGVTTQNGSYGLGLTQLTPLGTQLSFDLNGATNQTYQGPLYSDYASSLATLGLSQPLLKGFGTNITSAQIRIARHGEAAADAQFQSQAQQIISDVVSAYVELIYAQDNLRSQQASFKLAQQLLEDNQRRLKIGVMTPLDIAQAASEAASRQDGVLQASISASEQETALKRLISDDLASIASQRILPVDRPKEDLAAKPPLEEMAAALKNRPDYQRAIEEAKQSNIQLVFSQNQLLPALNLNASYGFGGVGSSVGNSFNKVNSADYPQWYAGLSLQLPFGNREARGRRDADRLRKAEALFQIKKLEQDILVQVNNAANRVTINQARVGFLRTATEYSKKALSAEQQKLNAGTTTTYTVLQMQRDLAQAETNEMRALADLRKSEVELYRVEGITFKMYHVTIDQPSLVKRESLGSSAANKRQTAR